MAPAGGRSAARAGPEASAERETRGQRFKCLKIRSMTSSWWGELIGETIFMGFPQVAELALPSLAQVFQLIREPPDQWVSRGTP